MGLSGGGRFKCVLQGGICVKNGERNKMAAAAARTCRAFQSFVWLSCISALARDSFSSCMGPAWNTNVHESKCNFPVVRVLAVTAQVMHVKWQEKEVHKMARSKML